MKVGIMQPYLFPYIGYFQLINAVDKFVILDDVQYIKRGWINRNRILVSDKDYMFTFSLEKRSSSLDINKRYFSKEFFNEKDELFKTLKWNYGNLDNFNEIILLLDECLKFDIESQNIARNIARSLTLINNYLDITTPLLFSSELEKNEELKGEEKIIEINKQLGSSHYINPIGGIDLYSKRNFDNQNIKLSFLKSKSIEYKQKKNFIPWLSIIDVLMFNTKDQIKEFITEFELA